MYKLGAPRYILKRVKTALSTGKLVHRCPHQPCSNSQNAGRTGCPTADGWRNRMWSVHTVEYYLAIKRSGSLLCPTGRNRKHHAQWKSQTQEVPGGSVVPKRHRIRCEASGGRRSLEAEGRCVVLMTTVPPVLQPPTSGSMPTRDGQQPSAPWHYPALLARASLRRADVWVGPQLGASSSRYSLGVCLTFIEWGRGETGRLLIETV